MVKSISEIAEELGISKVAITQIINDLGQTLVIMNKEDFELALDHAMEIGRFECEQHYLKSKTQVVTVVGWDV